MAHTHGGPSATRNGAVAEAHHPTMARPSGAVASFELRQRRRMSLDWWKSVRATSRLSTG